MREFTGKMPRPRTVLCEPAKSTCTWTYQKSHVMRKFTQQQKKRAKDRDNRFVRAAFLSHVIFPGTFSHVFFFKPRKTTLLRKSVTHVLSRNDFIFFFFFIFLSLFFLSFFSMNLPNLIFEAKMLTFRG